MTKPSLLLAALACICSALNGAAAFSLNLPNIARSPQSATSTKKIPQTAQAPLPSNDEETLTQMAAATETGEKGIQQSLLAGCMTFLTTTPLSAFAESIDDMEIAELPPVYVPVIFGILVIGGVGVLTASLGDVYTEEASLGLQSGARAKKERERSRSSYFKK
ncbi:hypothetical protein ACHAXT_008415 [Thalassiosira profunda]